MENNQQIPADERPFADNVPIRGDTSLPALELRALSKHYRLYDRPQDRLRQYVSDGLGALARRYGQPRDERCHYRIFKALENVTLSVARGETLGIVGRNGSGKSTLLQLVAGTLKASSGEVVTRGRVAALLELGSGFNPDFTGRENVFTNAAILGLSREAVEARLDEILDFADIGDFVDQPVKSYSSGMLVRLAFAVSVCVDPDILIVDEALSVGDAAFQFKCLGRIRELSEKGTTLLFVSHDMGMVKTFCHRVVYLERGAIKAVGDPQSIASQYFLDIRRDQRKHLGQQSSNLGPLSPLGDADQASAFGDGNATISRAWFCQTNGPQALFEVGALAELEVDLNLAPSAPEQTFLALVIQDSRLVELAGQRFAIPQDASKPLKLQWTNRLAPGEYFISLRIEEQVGRDVFIPLLVQLAAMRFQSAWDERLFLGAMDPLMQRVEP